MKSLMKLFRLLAAKNNDKKQQESALQPAYQTAEKLSESAQKQLVEVLYRLSLY